MFPYSWENYAKREGDNCKCDTTTGPHGCLQPFIEAYGDVIETNVNVSSCTVLTTLPPRLCVVGDLILNHCRSLKSLPEGLLVGANLSIVYCPYLVTLPKRLAVSGTLVLDHCNNLVSLPDDIKVGGSISLAFCESITKLPEGLNVHGDLNPKCCDGLVSLPTGLCVSGDLQLGGCYYLSSLPPGLNVAGNIKASGCGLTTLPPGFTFTGALDLSQGEFTTLPEGVVVEGNLNLSLCTDLKSLPNSLCVSGNLNLKNCCNLAAISSQVRVMGTLSVESCSRLAGLPEGLAVGEIKLNDCYSLTSLPSDVDTWGLTESGRQCEVDLTESIFLPEQVRFRIEAHVPDGTRFILGNKTDRRRHKYASLRSALNEWIPQPHRSSAVKKWLKIDAESGHRLLQFLSRLHYTDEIRNPATAGCFVKRVGTLLYELQKRATLLELCNARIMHSLQHDTDRGLSVIRELDLAVRVHAAQQSEGEEAELRELGIGYMKLDIVHQHAAVTCERWIFADRAEVFLVFETKLREALSLPIAPSEMEYGVQIGQAEINAAKEAALTAAADVKQRDAFLATWQPWQDYLVAQYNP